MPIQDGYEATKIIRKIEATKGGHTVIIGLTANTYDSEKERSLAAGMDGFLTKPFDIELFKEILNSFGFNIIENGS